MPDITMCTGEGCALKKRCYRNQAKPDPLHQSYFAAPPFIKETGECLYFWDMSGEPVRRPKSS